MGDELVIFIINMIWPLKALYFLGHTLNIYET